MAHAEIVGCQRCHRIGTTNAFATSVVKNATSGTSTAVLRAPTGRIVDTSCRGFNGTGVSRAQHPNRSGLMAARTDRTARTRQ